MGEVDAYGSFTDLFLCYSTSALLSFRIWSSWSTEDSDN